MKRLTAILTVFVLLVFGGCGETDNKEVKQASFNNQTGPVTLVIHGGAGTITRDQMTDEMEAAYREKLSEALNAGYSVLNEGGASMDAIVAVILMFFPFSFPGIDVSSEAAAYLSTLFDVGGIVGGILAGLFSDYTGKSATTCAVMLILAIPMVSTDRVSA